MNKRRLVWFRKFQFRTTAGWNYLRKNGGQFFPKVRMRIPLEEEADAMDIMGHLGVVLEVR